MRRFLMITLSLFFLTGCGVFDRGNYEKDREGYVINDELIVKYHTNAVGEIDLFILDERLPFFEALKRIGFNAEELTDHPTVSNYITPEVLDDACGITSDSAIPRFLNINDQHYFYHIRDNGYCTYDEYVFHETGFDSGNVDIETTSPIENIDVLRFNRTNFLINPFIDIVSIEEITYNAEDSIWQRAFVNVLPMSLSQAGNVFESNQQYLAQLSIIEQYVLTNQSINLLILKEDFDSTESTMIWSEETVNYLGRNHDIIRHVDTENMGEIIALINDVLSRLGMF
ncbi:MAG: hypothetical protein UMR38_02495 [Candidatus Izemoplasma sp.]|nr:hypothetical protein [Candidatus Izemoplasma sp.]